MNTDIVYKYTGNGAFVVGIPARDIQEWEVTQDAELKAAIEANLATPGPLWTRQTPVAASKKTAKPPVNVTESPEGKAE